MDKDKLDSISSKEDIRKLTNDELIELYKRNNFSLSAIDKKYASKNFALKLFRKRGIDYNKILEDYKQELIDNYNANPNKCLHCGREFDYNHRNNLYCSSSCSASDHTGIIRNPKGIGGFLPSTGEKKKKKKKKKKSDRKVNPNSYSKIKTPPVYNYCKNCGAPVPSSRLFCSQSCCREYRQKEAYNDFLNNPEKYCRPNYTPKPFKKIFLEEQGGVCAICGCKPEWNGKPLVFILDHINGDASDNHRENLRIICPNCDTQLPTFKSKNKNSTRRNYWKNKIINDLSNKNKTDDQQDNNKSD